MHVTNQQDNNGHTTAAVTVCIKCAEEYDHYYKRLIKLDRKSGCFCLIFIFSLILIEILVIILVI